MRYSPTLFTAALLLLLLGGINVARGDDKPTSNDLGNIRPPGGVPLMPGGGGVKITVDMGRKMSKRLEAIGERQVIDYLPRGFFGFIVIS